MNPEFIDIVKTLVAEQGKDALINPAKCKAFLADYAKGEFSKERRLLLRVIETGAAKEIDTAADLDICKKRQIRHLKEELFMAEDVAVDVVDMLALVLRGDMTKTKPVPKPAPEKPRETLYNISFNYQQSGPYKMAQLLQMAENGQISKEHWICPVNTSNWVQITTIVEINRLVEAREKAKQELLAEQARMEEQERREARMRADDDDESEDEKDDDDFEDDDEDEDDDDDDDDDEDEDEDEDDFEDDDEDDDDFDDDDFDEDDDDYDEDIDYDDDEDDSNKKGCFITSAVCTVFSMPDDCYELTLFRNFRDNWLSSQPEGARLIKRYYRIAPEIVAVINKLPGRDRIYKNIWDNYLSRCLHLIEGNYLDECKEKYIQMVEDLEKKYLQGHIL